MKFDVREAGDGVENVLRVWLRGDLVEVSPPRRGATQTTTCARHYELS